MTGMSGADPADHLPPDARHILVVIPTLNEAKHIESCLQSLLGDSSWSAGLACIVADGGSTDDTRAKVTALKARFPGLRLIDNPDRFQSAGINQAVAAGVGPATRFLIRCDAHAAYPPGFVSNVARRLEETGAESVVIPMDAVGETCFGRANAWIVDTPLGNGGASHRGGRTSQWVDHGHHAGFRREAFERLGGYDPDFSHNEDAEYDMRLAQAGGALWLAADLRIDYVARSTPASLARQYLNYGKGRARTSLKHGQALKPRQALPILALLACSLSLMLSPAVPWILLVPGGYAGLLVATSGVMALRHRSACGLLTGLAAGIMHMSWAAGYLAQLARTAARRAADMTRRFQPKGQADLQHRRQNSAAWLRRRLSRHPGRPAFNLTHIKAQNWHGRKLDNARGAQPEDGECIYAIGDIHGRCDLLLQLLDLIDADAATVPDGIRKRIVFLGDYIDRGDQSRAVIDVLTSDRLDAYDTVFLAGNHEDALFRFREDALFGAEWLRFGGGDTLVAYGALSAGQRPVKKADWIEVWRTFQDALPESHLRFFNQLKYIYLNGDLAFVHAGLRPGVAIADQAPQDMMWIRETFLHDTGPFPRFVVHGHTPCETPEIDHRRLGLDTGAYSTGILTAARLLGTDISLLATSPVARDC